VDTRDDELGICLALRTPGWDLFISLVCPVKLAIPAIIPGRGHIHQMPTLPPREYILPPMTFLKS